MSNQPVYRHPPRSHAGNCQCRRCVQCRSRPSPGSDLMKFDMGCLGVLFLFAAVSAVAGWVARNSHAVLGVLPAAGALALIIGAVVYVNRRAVRPPKGRLRVEATTPGQLRPPPASVRVPRCLHPNAVRVAGGAWPQETLENWCPGCDTQLGAAFRWSCCGAPPGDNPGDGHLYNCPHLTGDPR